MSNQPRRRGPMGGGHGRMGTGEKAKDFKGTMKKLFTYLSEYKIGIFFVMIFAIGSTVFNIVGPKILGKATTEIFKGLVGKVSGGSGIDFTKIGKILLTLLCLYVISACFSFIQGYIMTGVSQKLTYRMRKEISEKINRMPMNYFDTTTHGEVLSRVTNDVDTLSQSLNQSATQMITSVTTIIGVLIMMISISPLMTVIALLILPVSMVLISVIVKHSQKYFKSQQEYLGHINGQVEEVYGGHLVVQAYNKQESTIKKFEDTNQILFQSAWKSQFLSGLMQPIMQFVGNLGYVGVAISGGLLAIRGTIGVGEIQAFIQYVKNFTQPIQQIAQVINQVQSMTAASERVFEFLEEEEEDQEHEGAVSVENVTGEVKFSHVNFGYNPNQTIINDFSVDVKPGQKIAIVGPTGAGKTTMVKLLMRFYDVNSGQILLDGEDITGLNITERARKGISFAFQQPVHFKGLTVKDLITIAAGKEMSVNEICDILSEVGLCAREYIDREINGSLSGGELKRIEIAMITARGTKLSIFDEPEAGIDLWSFNSLIKVFEKMRDEINGTILIISHQERILDIADKIIVIADGQVRKTGTKAEVLPELLNTAQTCQTLIDKA